MKDEEVINSEVLPMNLRCPIRHARNPLAGIQRMVDGFPLEDCGNDRRREFMDTPSPRLRRLGLSR
jgi:hypothetical protein